MAAVAEARTRKLARGLARGRRRQDGVALALYTAAWLALIGRDAVADPAHTCACRVTSDPTAYMWSFVWWPHAIVHGLNPFFTHAIWPPGTNVGATATVPAVGLALSPITAALGPIVTYNVTSLLGPVLAAWLMFRLCRYLTGRWVPSLVAGYIFGFSSYVLAHMFGHLNLVLIFVLPAAAHLILLRLDERVRSRRFVGLMAGLLVLQFLISTEVLLTMLGFGALALVFGYVFESPSRRARIRSLVPQVLLAGAIAAVVLGPFVYYAAKGIAPNPSVAWESNANLFSTDPLNYAIPTPVTWIGHQLTGSLAPKFISDDGGAHGKYDESAAYLGLPLLVLVGWFLVARRRRTAARVLAGLLVVVGLASLGAHLHVVNPPHGADTVYRGKSIPLLWLPMSHLPVVDHVLPARLALYVFFIAAIVVALALAEPGRRRGPRWALAGVGVLALLPNQALPYWHGRPQDPRFFTTSLYQRYLHRDEIVLVVPFGWNGNSMLWQAETGMRFRMVGGYLSPEVPPGYWREPVVRALLASPAKPVSLRRWQGPLRDLIVRRRVGAVVVGPGASTGWSRVVASLGLTPLPAGDVVVYDVPPGWRA